MAYKGRKNQTTVLETIFVGIFRGLWWLLSLPFRGLQKKEKISLEDKQYILNRKNEIEKILLTDDIFQLKHAVFEADKLVDLLLKKRNFVGNTFAERLRSAEKGIPKDIYNGIWEGHKIRNRLAHEDNFQSNTDELKNATKNLLKYLRIL